MPHLEITEVLLVHCSIANNNYQYNSRVLYKFIPNESFGKLLKISPKKFKFSKTFNSDFSFDEVWFTDQDYKPLEIEDQMNITLVIN